MSNDRRDELAEQVNESGVVWWSKTGKRLHRDPDCPEFMRARARAIARMTNGDYTAASQIQSYDFEGDNIDITIYPPQWMQLCERCGRR